MENSTLEVKKKKNRSVREAAMYHGFRLGLEMTLAFGFYMVGIHTSVLWVLLSLFFCMLVIVHAVFSMFMFRFIEQAHIGRFFSVFGFSLGMFFYATLLLAVPYYIYFQYLDHGFVVQNIQAALTEPESRNLMIRMSSLQQVSQMDESLSQLFAMTPIQYTFQLMFMNLMMCLPLAVIGSLVVGFSKEPKLIAWLRIHRKDSSD